MVTQENRALWDRLVCLDPQDHLASGVVLVMMEREVFRDPLVIRVCLDFRVCLECLGRRDTGACRDPLATQAQWDRRVSRVTLVKLDLQDLSEKWVLVVFLDREDDQALLDLRVCLVLKAQWVPKETWDQLAHLVPQDNKVHLDRWVLLALRDLWGHLVSLVQLVNLGYLACRDH